MLRGFWSNQDSSWTEMRRSVNRRAWDQRCLSALVSRCCVIQPQIPTGRPSQTCNTQQTRAAEQLCTQPFTRDPQMRARSSVSPLLRWPLSLLSLSPLLRTQRWHSHNALNHSAPDSSWEGCDSRSRHQEQRTGPPGCSALQWAQVGWAEPPSAAAAASAFQEGPSPLCGGALAPGPSAGLCYTWVTAVLLPGARPSLCSPDCSPQFVFIKKLFLPLH